jgi:hypothetical protein
MKVFLATHYSNTIHEKMALFTGKNWFVPMGQPVRMQVRHNNRGHHQVLPERDERQVDALRLLRELCLQPPNLLPQSLRLQVTRVRPATSLSDANPTIRQGAPAVLPYPPHFSIIPLLCPAPCYWRRERSNKTVFQNRRVDTLSSPWSHLQCD